MCCLCYLLHGSVTPYKCLLLYFSVYQLHLFGADNLLEKGGGGVVDTFQQKNHPIIFQVAILEQKKEEVICRAKPLVFGASAGENICARDLTHPPFDETGPVRLCLRDVRDCRYAKKQYATNLCVCVQWIYL